MTSQDWTLEERQFVVKRLQQYPNLSESVARQWFAVVQRQRQSMEERGRACEHDIDGFFV